MKKIFEVIFPLGVYLHVLQLEQYRPMKLWQWFITHPFKRKIGEKKPLVWTPKAKLLFAGSLVWIYVLLRIWWPGGVIAFLLPWIPLSLSLFGLKPFEAVNRSRVKDKTIAKINSLSRLRVIGIAGSFGKTTVKEYLFQILSKKYRVLRTPENYNTLLGIAKVVDLELDEHYDFFICEMGAYKKGEIAELCQVLQPQYGILTGINEQHLERFGSIENIIRAKFELVDFILKKGGKVVANVGSEPLRGRLKEYKDFKDQIFEYGMKEKDPLGQNLEGAKTMAKVLGMSDEEIKEAVKEMKQPEHRLNVIDRGLYKIIDDAYSSNPDGFKAAIKYLSEFKEWKVVVTPGIVELGKATREIHRELGGLMTNVVDQLILVGKNERTENLEKGYGKSVEYIEDVKDALGKVKEKKSIILFENDLPDNY